MKKILLLTLSLLCLFNLYAKATLREITQENVPQSMQELWDTFDADAEALEPEILYESQIDGVQVKVIRINVATVNGEVLKVAGVYGYPKGAKNLPALLQIHGGGQYANVEAVVANAKRGYATFSLAWAGRILCDKYNLRADNLQAFWAGNIDDPKYALTTDWQSLEGYHAPNRWGKSSYSSKPSEHTLDKIVSPRNSAWFLWTMAGKRAITFLTKQAEVDSSNIGVYGHSMGGHLTTLVAGSDPRVKAAVPSCGGVNTSYEKEKDELLKRTIEDKSYLENMSCPIAFLSPSNDFNGNIDDTARAIDLIKTDEWRVVSSPHTSHQDNPEYEIATLLFFDEHLKNTFKFPKTPSLKLDTKEAQNPKLFVEVDNTKEIESVEIYYTTAGKRDRDYNKTRFWHFVETKKESAKTYSGEISLSTTKNPLWVYANVKYKLDKEYSFAGYYYRLSTTDTLVVSSKLLMLEPESLVDMNPKITDTHSNIILDSSNKNWKKDFYRYNLKSWGIITNKLSDDAFKASKNAKLYLEISSKEFTSFVLVLSDDYYCEVSLLSEPNSSLQIILEAKDFKNFNDEELKDFSNLGTLQILPYYNSKAQVEKGVKGAKGATKTIGDKNNKAPMPDFKLIKWIQ